MFGKRKKVDEGISENDDDERSKKKQRSDNDLKVIDGHKNRGFSIFNLLFTSNRMSDTENDYNNHIIDEISENVFDFGLTSGYMRPEIVKILEKVILDISVITFSVHPIKKTVNSSTTKQEFLEKMSTTKNLIRKFTRFLISSIHYYYIRKYISNSEDNEDYESDEYPINYIKKNIYGFYEESQDIESTFETMVSHDIPDNIEEIVNNTNLPEPKILSMLGGRFYVKQKMSFVSFSYFSSMSSTKNMLDTKLKNLASIPKISKNNIDNTSSMSNFHEYIEFFVNNLSQIKPIIDKYTTSEQETETITYLKDNIFTNNENRYNTLKKFFLVHCEYLWSLHRINQTKERVKLLLIDDNENTYKLSRILEEKENSVDWRNIGDKNLTNKFIIIDKEIVLTSVLIFDKNKKIIFTDIAIGGPKNTQNKLLYCFNSNVQILDDMNGKQIPYTSQSYPKKNIYEFAKSKGVQEMVVDTEEPFNFFGNFDSFRELIKNYGNDLHQNNIEFTVPFMYTINHPIFDQRLTNTKNNKIRIDFSFSQLYKKQKDNSKNDILDIELIGKNFKFVAFFSKPQFFGALKNGKKYQQTINKSYESKRNSSGNVFTYENFVNGKRVSTTIRLKDLDTTVANIGFESDIKFIYDDQPFDDTDDFFKCYVVVKKDSGIPIEYLNKLPNNIKNCAANNIFNKIYSNSNYNNVPIYEDEFQIDLNKFMVELFGNFVNYEMFEKRIPDTQGDLSFIGLLQLSISTYLVDSIVYLSYRENMKRYNLNANTKDNILTESISQIAVNTSSITKKIFHSGSYVDITESDLLEYNRTTLFIKLLKDTVLLSEEYCKNKMSKCSLLLYIFTKYLKNWFSIRSVYPSSRILLIKPSKIQEFEYEKNANEDEKIKRVYENVRKSTDKLQEHTESFLYLLKSSGPIKSEEYETKITQSFKEVTSDITTLSNMSNFAYNCENFIKDYISKDQRFKSGNSDLILEAKKDFIEVKNLFREFFIAELNRNKMSKNIPPGAVYLSTNPIFEI